MLVQFKSKAASDVLMYEQHAKRILDLLHKDVAQGIITAGEMPDAVAQLEQEIAFTRHNPVADVTQHEGLGRDSENEEEEQEAKQAVSFAARAYPLLEMMRAAQQQGANVVWGV